MHVKYTEQYPLLDPRALAESLQIRFGAYLQTYKVRFASALEMI